MITSQSTKALECKDFSGSLSLHDDTTSAPKFTGYAAIFDTVDRDGDRLTADTFKDSLVDQPRPALLWQHDPTMPIGRFTKLTIDQKGLYVEAELSDTGKGKEAYDLIKLGALDGLSVGFITKEAVRDPSTGIRTVRKAMLAEISLVTFPAHKDARVSSVKSLNNRPDYLASRVDFERFLRKGGVSRRDAKALVAKGFSGLSTPFCSTAQLDDVSQSSTEIEALVLSLRLKRERLKIRENLA